MLILENTGEHLLWVLSPASQRLINETVLSFRGFRRECSSVCIRLIFNGEEQSLLLLCKKKKKKQRISSRLTSDYDCTHRDIQKNNNLKLNMFTFDIVKA